MSHMYCLLPLHIQVVWITVLLVYESGQDLFQFNCMALHKGFYIPSQCSDGQCLMLSGSHMANIIIIKPIKSLWSVN